MAWIETCFFSEVLGMQTKMNVLIPQREDGAHLTCPVLYLLHGMSQDYTAWLRNSLIERYVEQYGFVAIMPDAGLGWYTDMKYGFAYWTFLTQELPAVCHHFFPQLSNKREDTFVAGLSMGAYGALKCGILCADKYSAVGAFSAPPDILHHMRNETFPAEEHALMHDIFGTEEEYRGSINDLYAQALIHAADALKARIYMSCGTEDIFLTQSRTMYDALTAAAYDVTYHETSGDHNWDFWNAEIENFLKFLVGSMKGAR